MAVGRKLRSTSPALFPPAYPGRSATGEFRGTIFGRHKCKREGGIDGLLVKVRLLRGGHSAIRAGRAGLAARVSKFLRSCRRFRRGCIRCCGVRVRCFDPRPECCAELENSSTARLPDYFGCFWPRGTRGLEFRRSLHEHWDTGGDPVRMGVFGSAKFLRTGGVWWRWTCGNGLGLERQGKATGKCGVGRAEQSNAREWRKSSDFEV
jgi:hypothetical protein